MSKIIEFVRLPKLRFPARIGARDRSAEWAADDILEALKLAANGDMGHAITAIVAVLDEAARRPAPFTVDIVLSLSERV